MAQWDVQVLGLDENRPAARVREDVARRLGAELAQVERLLAHAPTTLVADLDEDAAKALVLELRELGLRVKPRPSGSPALPSGPPPRMSTPAPRVSVTDERATGPTLSVPTAFDPPRTALERLAASDTGHSGLELEDVGAPVARAQPVSARPPSVRPPAPEPAPVAPTIARSEPEPEEAPRTFWTSLPGAFVVPLRTPVLPGLIAAPVFLGLALLCSVLGTFTAIVGVLLMMAAFVGVTMQVSHRCLWATAVGERMPASLPFDFVSEYAFPGIAIVIVQAMMGAMLGWVALQAVQHGVPLNALRVGGVVFFLYGVVGFALTAANRSALAYFDFIRIFGILMRAPLEVVAIAIIGVLIQGSAVAIGVAQFAAAYASGGGIGASLLAVAGSTVVLGLAVSYGYAVTSTMMGMLFWARPEVAGK